MAHPAACESRDRQHWLADGCLLLIAFIWGFSFVIVKQAVMEVPVFYFNALRFTVATLTFLPFAGRQWHGWKPAFGPGLLLSLFMYAGFSFQASGLQYTTPSKSAFITASSVVVVPFILRFVFGRRSDRSALLGIAAGFLGLYLLAVPQESFSLNWGDLLTGLGAIAWAWYLVLAAQFSPRHSTVALAAVQIIACAGAFWLTAFGLGEVRALRMTYLPAVLYGGTLATSFCFVLQLWAQRHTSATRAGLLLTTEPLFAAMTSYLWIGERLTGRQIFGASFIIAGVLLAEAGYQWRFLSRRRVPQTYDKI